MINKVLKLSFLSPGSKKPIKSKKDRLIFLSFFEASTPDWYVSLTRSPSLADIPGRLVAYKMDGKCYIGTVTLRENYEGGGRYGPLDVGFTSTSNQRDKGIGCLKVK